jgi:hypothetical protein
MPSAQVLHRTKTLGCVAELRKVFQPQAACEMASGHILVAENRESSRLPILSADGTLVRHLVAESQAFDSPVAVIPVEDGAALIVVEACALTKLRMPDGKVIKKLAIDKRRTFVSLTAAALIDDVLYVVDHGRSCVLTFDPSSLKARTQRFGTKPVTRNYDSEFNHDGEFFSDGDDGTPEVPTALREPTAVHAHPEGVMVVDAGSGRVVVFGPDGTVAREYTGFVSPFDAVLFGGFLVVAEKGDRLSLHDATSGEALGQITVESGQFGPFLRSLLVTSAGLCAVEMLPHASLHFFALMPLEAATMSTPSPPAVDTIPLRLEAPPEFDVCVVGAGAVGCAIARDVASTGFTVLLVEADAVVGGVWHRNKYPNLRLHAPGVSYRALSVAPAWQAPELRMGEPDRIAYRPYQEEILRYIQDLAQHPNVTLRTSTSFCYAEERADGDGGNGRRRVVCSSLVASVRALVHATGTYEVTAGKPYAPFDVSNVTNGATVIHSSALSAHQAAFDAAKTKYIIGASKAAVDVLNTLDPADESIVWAHRGHIIFTSRDQVARDAVRHSAASAERSDQQRRDGMAKAIAGTQTANQLLRSQQFAGYSQMCMSSGKGIAVGEPLSKSGIAQRGGIESEAVIMRLRQFATREHVVDSMRVYQGALNLVSESGKLRVPSEGDIVVLCTGQRAEGFGPTYHADCAKNNRDGIFQPYALSGTATAISVYWVKMILDYLEGDPSSVYVDGRLHEAAKRVGDHMGSLPDKSPWASFMTFLGTN